MFLPTRTIHNLPNFQLKHSLNNQTDAYNFLVSSCATYFSLSIIFQKLRHEPQNNFICAAIKPTKFNQLT
uniref:Uncharacterized protein n=1 Tax=Arundo donax TaxID=35708 RepID=A0A0A9GWX6_ARUDO